MRKSKSTEQGKVESTQPTGVQLHIYNLPRNWILGGSVARTQAAAIPLLSASSAALASLTYLIQFFSTYSVLMRTLYSELKFQTQLQVEYDQSYFPPAPSMILS